MAADGYHIWNSVSNVRDISIAGSAAIAFDYVMTGPESPNDFHAVALVLQSKFVFVTSSGGNLIRDTHASLPRPEGTG